MPLVTLMLSVDPTEESSPNGIVGVVACGIRVNGANRLTTNLVVSGLTL